MSRLCKVYKKLLDAEQNLKHSDFLVAADVTTSGIKQYCIFDNYMDFITECNNRLREGKQNHFYEIIYANEKQKIYFDIDVKGNYNVHDGISKLQEMVKSFIPDAKLEIHTSGDDSWHIVIGNYYVADADLNKYIVTEVAKSLDHEIGNDIDLSLYKTKQLFRIEGSCKKGKDNVKRLFEGSDFLSSLVTNVSNESVELIL